MTLAMVAKTQAWLTGLTGCEWQEDAAAHGYRCNHGVVLENDFIRAAMARLVTPTATVAQERREG